MSETAPLFSDLAAILDQHGVAPTVDGLLAEFDERGWRRRLISRARGHTWAVAFWPQGSFESPHYEYGPTALIALARAFRAMVGGTEQ